MNDKPDAAPSLALPLDIALPDLLDSLPDGAYITDTHRQILFWNKAAERITGWRAKDVIGRNCADNILAHVDKDGHALCGCEHCPLHRSIVTAQPSLEPIVVFARRKYGISAPVEVSVAPIRDREGKVIGGIEIFRDMTESMQDLLRAKGIQEQAVACSLPDDSRLRFEVRYQPREIVGGDFYRIEKRNKDQYALLIADAMGHGVAAALHTMQLRAVWDDCHKELDSPSRFLAAINQRVHGLVRDAGYFATATCASYDAKTGKLHCVRAGHPAPLLFRRDGLVEPIGRPQLALGMLPQTSYVETSLLIDPGDALLLFTDGAIELFDPLQQELGTEGLKQLVRDQTSGQSPADFRVEVLEQQLLEFSNSIHLPDDLTLVKLHRLV
jgi:PAS domain S-box-containing protein